MKKKLFKKVATIVAATVLGTVTILGSTVAFAADNSDSQECKIAGVYVNLEAEGIEGGLDPQVNKELAGAFDKIILSSDDETISYVIKVKDFKYFGEDSYISKMSATNTIYEGEKYYSDSKNETVDFKVIEKDENSHPTAFKVTFKSANEWIVAGFIDVEITSGVEKVGIKDVELLSPSAALEQNKKESKSDEQKAKTEDKKEVANNTSDKKTEETVKPTEAPKQTPAPTTAPTKKAETNKDKTPKTADEMSTAVMWAMILGSVSMVSIIGIHVYKRKKNNI